MPANDPLLHIYWHHLGREHGGSGYAGDLRKNDPQIVSAYLASRERPRPAGEASHRLVRHDENTLVELSPEGSDSPFFIAYFIDHGLQYSLGYKKSHPGWLIDIIEIEETRPNVFCVRDLFLDIKVDRDGGGYEVLDEADYQEALRLELMTERQIMRSVRSLKMALDELAAGKFPNPRLSALVEQYFPPAERP